MTRCFSGGDVRRPGLDRPQTRGTRSCEGGLTFRDGDSVAGPGHVLPEEPIRRLVPLRRHTHSPAQGRRIDATDQNPGTNHSRSSPCCFCLGAGCQSSRGVRQAAEDSLGVDGAVVATQPSRCQERPAAPFSPAVCRGRRRPRCLDGRPDGGGELATEQHESSCLVAEHHAGVAGIPPGQRRGVHVAPWPAIPSQIPEHHDRCRQASRHG